MMLLYTIGIRLYFVVIYVASLFNQKASQWINGRKNQQFIRINNCIWFHFASLGEFEQGRPILEALRTRHPDKKIVVSFFSPSGYEVRKNTPLADFVYYLPLDTAKNATQFIDAIQPEMAVFTKYEYWYHFFNQLHKRRVPLYIVSGIFRPKQIFFKWYGGLHRKILSFVTYFFLQDEASKQLLQSIGVTNTAVSGDTRFDRVWANAQHPKEIPGIAQFKNDQKLFIAGSTWPQDEALLATLPALYPDWKFIFAPHEIGEEKVNNLVNLLPSITTARYSELIQNSKFKIQNQDATTHHSPLTTLIIDNIGMLSSLYAYADIAYIGGGFGVGIHNTLEAAAFGLPVIFGPNYQKFNEAKQLITLRAGFSISDVNELKGIVETLIGDEAFYSVTSKKAAEFVREHIGATEAILGQIDS
ncbi:3-deoxy-D-manno-octulosonic acid transferase [Mucilaginibacter flavus]|uniref:3-deoxy-D-manno-octulosonic acid transferase n=1 Tax=Mucilaginibacter flavus TaxID=931504 RepID=UPI0025B49F85|nr:glycosyltransferase N-terminal domain-containing protein [Mucilaginibacter flavus]MDN3579526.1 glycosyltransferase N-terminal domain-containing protein [Mucilaginibacter flavus]